MTLLQEYICAVLLNEEKVHQNIKNYDEIKELFEKFVEKFKDDAAYNNMYFSSGQRLRVIDKGKYIRALGQHLVITTHVPAVITQTSEESFHNPDYISVESSGRISYRSRSGYNDWTRHTMSKDKFASFLKIAKGFEQFEVLISRMT